MNRNCKDTEGILEMRVEEEEAEAVFPSVYHTFDSKVIKEILVSGRELGKLLLGEVEERLVMGPPVSKYAFLCTLMNLRCPPSLDDAFYWTLVNYIKFSANYYRVCFTMATIMTIFNLSLGAKAVAGGLLLLCGFLKLQDWHLGEHLISTVGQRLYLLHTALFISGVEKEFLLSLFKVSVLVLLHMVFHNP
ncbi:hypothetical protein OTU49_007183, partial [Cherax quadricarinatus]